MISFQKKYTADFEEMKDQIYFMQTDTPTYASNKKAREAASTVSFFKEFIYTLLFFTAYNGVCKSDNIRKAGIFCHLNLDISRMFIVFRKCKTNVKRFKCHYHIICAMTPNEK